jgi:hypothetical protein
MSFTVAYDVTAENYGKQPVGETMLYVTGSASVVATPEMRAAHPDAVLIDQTPSNTSPDAVEWNDTADVDDYENGAVTLAELAPRAHARIASFQLGKRNGQREPLVYMSASNVTSVVNALVAGGISSGVGLFVAHWGLTNAQAASELAAASGPFPVQAIQFEDEGAFDVSLVDSTWLSNRSGAKKPAADVAVPPGQWAGGGTWTWTEAAVSGTGLDGKLHSFSMGSGKNQWVKLA